MPAGPTLTLDVLDPEIIAGDIQTAATKALELSKLVKVDGTLEGVPGSTITVPKYKSIGMAPRLNETDRIVPKKLELESATVSIREAGDGLSFTKKALAVAYGDPVGEATTQLGTSVADRIEYDLIEAASATVGGSAPFKVTLATANTVNWATWVSGFLKFGDKGFKNLAGIVMTSAAYSSLLNDPDFMADARARGTSATNGDVVTVGGTTIYVTDVLSDIDPKLAALVLKKDAVALYWKSRPEIETARDIYGRSLEMAVSTIYAVSRTNDQGVVAFYNP